MNCPGCARPNASNRRFCGGCGGSLDHICRACAFANDAEDKFCGGCGQNLRVEAARPTRPAPPRIVEAPEGELVGLFSRAPKTDEPGKLPETGVSQTDLDRLFGGQG